MIWFTLREHRAQLVAMAITAALLAIGLAVMGSYAAAQRAALGVDTCVPLPNTNVNCADLSVEWQRRVGWAPYLIWALLLAPALAASFIGGPLFGGELERGTHRLAFTQAISRVRWSATKIGVALAITFVCALVLAQFGWAALRFEWIARRQQGRFQRFRRRRPPVGRLRAVRNRRWRIDRRRLTAGPDRDVSRTARLRGGPSPCLRGAASELRASARRVWKRVLQDRLRRRRRPGSPRRRRRRTGSTG